MSQTRPSSDVSWRRWARARPKASTRRGRRQDEHDGDAEAAVAAARPAERLAADREQPGEAARQRAACEEQDREREHRQPEMTLVVEREVAVAGMAGEREVEQDQRAEAGREHEARVADARAHRLRDRRRPCARRSACESEDRQRRRRAGEAEDEGARRAVPGGVGAAEGKLMAAAKRPGHARQPGGTGPGGERRGAGEHGRGRAPAPEQEGVAERHRRRPLPSGRGDEGAHRFVLARVGERLARIGHQRRGRGERLARASTCRRCAAARGAAGPRPPAAPWRHDRRAQRREGGLRWRAP